MPPAPSPGRGGDNRGRRSDRSGYQLIHRLAIDPAPYFRINHSGTRAHGVSHHPQGSHFEGGDTVRVRRSGSVLLAGVLLLATATPALAAPTDPLADFHQQQPSWSPCKAGSPTECASITVPLDYANPGGNRIRVAISRHKATDQAHRRGILLLNPGGPGGSGLGLADRLAKQQVAGVYDLVGFDPRGIGKSTKLQCTEVTGGPQVKNPTRPDDADLPTYTAWAQQQEHACQEAGGGLRPYINTNNTARDMDIIRAVLGEPKLNYLGYSYGTQLGATYGTLFPSRLDRNVLDSAMDPNKTWHEQDVDSVEAIGQNVNDWAAWVAARNNTFHLGTDAKQVKAGVEEIATALRTKPVAKLKDLAELDSSVGLYTRFRQGWAPLAKDLKAALDEVHGTGTADLSVAAGIARKRTLEKTVDGAYNTVLCEWDWPDERTSYRKMKQYRDTMPYGDAVGFMAPTPCAFRSFTRLETALPAKRDYPVGIVVQAEGDTQTAYPNGVAMAHTLGDNLISVRNEGVHGHYGSNTCVTALVDDYLINGVLPGSHTVCDPQQGPADIPPDTQRSAVAADIASLATTAQQIDAQLAESPAK
ncbi:alpha/beta fold hydrolase [Pseudonocardiaceae bacterium YIM PH 21723]|nr:alpha/beta fold hydrolase [Pseudonocardiaceae bacterium YIM PH 21723]